MSMGWCLTLVLALWMQQSWAGNPYCRFTPAHTLCKHKGLGSTCGKQVNVGVSQSDVNFILKQHNKYRVLVARGQEARGLPGPQPPASNMKKMEWDDELAKIAQSHANQCIFKHDCIDCRRVSRFGVGQNIFISSQSNFKTNTEWARALKSWYDEVAKFSPKAIQPYQFTSGVGHYTQMMWHDTWKIGCGYIMFKEGGWWKKMYTCNYGPAGNFRFSEMYRRGNPCTACPSGTKCSTQYPGLCWQIPTARSINPEQEFELAEFEQPEFEGGESDNQTNFIPMAGDQPRPTDLIPFLQRAGYQNTQVIRTNSLVDVRSIIQSLGSNMQPIVFFRNIAPPPPPEPEEEDDATSSEEEDEEE